MCSAAWKSSQQRQLTFPTLPRGMWWVGGNLRPQHYMRTSILLVHLLRFVTGSASMGYSYEVLSDTSYKNSSNSLLDFVRKWLLCGWIKQEQQLGAATAGSYVKPPRWKRLLRRVKAKTRKVQDACSEGLCFAPPQQEQQLNYQSMDSYKKNFDDGRESWECNHYYGTALQHQPILWEDVDFGAPAPLWQARDPIVIAAA